MGWLRIIAGLNSLQKKAESKLSEVGRLRQKHEMIDEKSLWHEKGFSRFKMILSNTQAISSFLVNFFNMLAV